MDKLPCHIRMPHLLISPILMVRRLRSVGYSLSLPMVLVHLALVALVTMAMITTLPTVALHV